MAQAPGAKLSLLSLTGPLDLFQKGLFKGQYKRYWFWFDEQTCCLKYYKNQQTYSRSVREPLGVIELGYAKVTPGLTSSNKPNNVFQISVNNQVYLLAAEDNSAAIGWIEKLQEKRSEFIKAKSAKHEANSEMEKRKTLSSLSKPVGTLAAEEASDESCSVRKIFNAKFQGDESSRLGVSLGLEHVKQPQPLLTGNCRGDTSRRATVANSPVRGNAENSTSEPSLVGDDSDSSADRETSEGATVLQPHERAQLALEACYLESQNKASKLQKELLHVQEQLQTREKMIEDLSMELASVKEELMIRKAPKSDLQMENENLKNIIDQYKRSVKSLDDEIELHKLNQAAHHKLIDTEKQKSADLEGELNFIKSRYVRLLSEQFKITVPSGGAVDSGEAAEESKYSKQLLELLKKEGGGSGLFEAYSQPFEDNYGDHYEWQGDTATQHYLCRLLDAHYNHQEQEKLTLEWEEFLSQCKPLKGNRELLNVTGDRQKLKVLLRKGVPLELRPHVWSSLVHQSIGRIKEVRDKASPGTSTYYQSLLKNASSSPSVKQIKLDLYRTLPGNRHFKSGGSGADKLERVLLAYSLHNEKIGYCQGMNMIAAMGLFFLDEETTFWFLVMVIEKLMPPGYYTPGLLAAQADIAVVKKLVPQMLPQINAHLQEYFIDVTLVTFNWFLTIFIDALPTESALRILDCFLFEGHKVLFRVAVAILKVNESHTLSMSDPVALFQFLKQVARHAFDVEQLFQAAFVQLNPFPHRKELQSWHQAGFATAKEQWMKREKQKVESEKQQQQPEQTLHLLSSIAPGVSSEVGPSARHLLWECGCQRGTQEVWLCCDEKGVSRVGIIHLDDRGTPQLELTECKVHSRVITLYHEPSSDLLLLGTLDFVLQAIDCKDKEVIWSHKFKDSILDIVGTKSGKILLGLADGNIAMLKHVDVSSWDDDPWHLHIGSSSVVSMVTTSEETVWCGSGKTIMVVNTEALEPVHSLLLNGKVNKMHSGTHGVWVSFRSSTKLCLYDSLSYLNLLEVDYTSLIPNLPLESKTKSTYLVSGSYRVTSLLSDGQFLYIGSGCGELLQFRVVAGVSDPEASIREFVAAKVKPRSGQSKRKSAYGDDPTSPTARGGLLAKDLLVKEGTELVSLEQVPVSESYYASKKRRTQFGRTLRRGRSQVEGLGPDHLSLYRLESLSHKLLGNALNEPVRVLLPMEGKILACLNRVGEWDKCVAVLSSPEQQQSDAAEGWIVDYVPSPRQPSPKQI